jgi:hypothetical protein
MSLKNSRQNFIWSIEGILNNGKTWFIPINRNHFYTGRSEDCHLTLASNTMLKDTFVVSPLLFEIIKDAY